MRALGIAIAAMIVLIGAASGSDPDEKKKAQPTEDEVIGLVGSRLARVFARFGEPKDLFPVNAPKGQNWVCLNYGSFDFLVSGKSVLGCRIWSTWQGTVSGVKFGSTSEEVLQKLGKPKSENDPQHLFWDYKSNGETLSFQVVLDKENDNKVKNFSILLQD